MQALLQLIEAWKQKLSSRDHSPAANAANGGRDNGDGEAFASAGAASADGHAILAVEVKVRTLKAPFIKFDDVAGGHKPVFAELPEWPLVHLADRPSTFSPFVKNGKDVTSGNDNDYVVRHFCMSYADKDVTPG